MSGLVFIKTENLLRITDFYQNIIGMKLWLEQPDINILRSNNLIIGFHQHDETETAMMITFFFETQEQVDEIYKELDALGIALGEPKINQKYQIYNFFAKDPDGRTIEFQKFLHELPDFKFKN